MDEKQETLLKEFLEKFSDLSKLTLDNYTRLGADRDDFTYWVEHKLGEFGGIKGGNSSKFGIYEYNTKPKSNYDEKYAWTSSFDKRDNAFEHVKRALIAIVKAAQSEEVSYDEIDEVALGDAYKWKVAFLYSSGKLVPVYTIRPLKRAARRLGISFDKNKATIGTLQKELMGYFNGNKGQYDDIYDFGAYVWEIGTSDFLRCNQLIKYGAPGTGKTYTTEKEAKGFFDEWCSTIGGGTNFKFNNHYEFVQFHPSYSYEDFIEGIKPVWENNNTVLKLKDGIFKAFCKRAAKYELWLLENIKNKPLEEITVGDVMEAVDNCSNHPFNYIKNMENAMDEKIIEYIPPYFFVIDEINRADLSRVFGELMYCLEYRGYKGKIKTQYSELQHDDTVFFKENEQNYFFIPKNVYIIGTMNTIDRSIESFDFALRRRFLWQRIDPNEDVLRDYFKRNNIRIGDYIIPRWKDLNNAIKKELGSDYQIGHSYLMKLDEYPGTTPACYRDAIWEKHIKPILEEYFRGTGREGDQIDDLKRIFYSKRSNG